MTKRVLLVEDNPDDIELTVSALRQHAHAEIDVAEDGVEALAYLERAAVLPDLILLDLKLPRMTGLQLLERLREDPRMRRLPVVVLTSSMEQSDVAASYDLGANSYVRKPVDFEEFIELAGKIGDYWLRVNRRAEEGT